MVTFLNFKTKIGQTRTWLSSYKSIKCDTQFQLLVLSELPWMQQLVVLYWQQSHEIRQSTLHISLYGAQLYQQTPCKTASKSKVINTVLHIVFTIQMSGNTAINHPYSPNQEAFISNTS